MTAGNALETPVYRLPPGMARRAFAAMGTTVELVLAEGDAARGEAMARALFEEWEDALSRFRPESELSRLNARAGEPVPVSPLLSTVLAAALRAARATDGAYDPTLLRQIIAVGYATTFEALPRDGVPVVSPVQLQPGGGWRQIRHDPARREVLLPRGVGLDFGGIAKGMAVDATVERLRAAGIEKALVNAGGDLAVLGPPPEGDAWPVAAPGRGEWWTVPLARGAMATSGIARRHWRQGDIERHHLLDPRTGAPVANGLWSVTAVAADCARAEVAAKVAFILGPAEGPRFLQRHGLAGLLIGADGQRIPVGAWPTDAPRGTAADTTAERGALSTSIAAESATAPQARTVGGRHP